MKKLHSLEKTSLIWGANLAKHIAQNSKQRICEEWTNQLIQKCLFKPRQAQS